ncbi:MAG: hypothetical protein DSZ28_02560 [Thiothrix sp.]|nr:MAG: hypothetical protein DSZ28_02560 [Thiothrix sp.]
MQSLRWLVAISLLLVAGFFIYQWSAGVSTEEIPQAVEAAPSPVVTEERSENIEPPPSPSAGGERKPEAEVRSNTPATGSAGVVNPFISPPEGSSGQEESADLADEEQEPVPEADQSETTTRDLLKEVPDSYPIENAEAYYVPPEERYPGNLGGPPPLKLPPINTPESAGEGGEPSGDLAPPAPF